QTGPVQQQRRELGVDVRGDGDLPVAAAAARLGGPGRVGAAAAASGLGPGRPAGPGRGAAAAAVPAAGRGDAPGCGRRAGPGVREPDLTVRAGAAGVPGLRGAAAAASGGLPGLPGGGVRPGPVPAVPAAGRRDAGLPVAVPVVTRLARAGGGAAAAAVRVPVAAGPAGLLPGRPLPAVAALPAEERLGAASAAVRGVGGPADRDGRVAARAAVAPGSA